MIERGAGVGRGATLNRSVRAAWWEAAAAGWAFAAPTVDETAIADAIKAFVKSEVIVFSIDLGVIVWRGLTVLAYASLK